MDTEDSRSLIKVDGGVSFFVDTDDYSSLIKVDGRLSFLVVP